MMFAPCRREPIRRGYSLIEVMVVISVSATLFLVAVAWIHQSMKVGTVMRQRQHHHQNLLRLSRQLRDDVHRGQSMMIADDNRLVITVAAEQSVIYTIKPESLLRQIRDGEQLTGQESFQIAPTAVVHWGKSELPESISLIVDRGPGVIVPQQAKGGRETFSGEPPLADLHVQAAVGRWQHGDVTRVMVESTLEESP